MTKGQIYQNNSVAEELEALGRVVESNLEMLRQARVSPKFEQQKMAFSIFSQGRNIIYRVKGDYSWYLKITKSRNKEAIGRELFGADRVSQVLGNYDGYWHPAVKASIENSYVIYSDVPGKTLHLALYSGCLTPFNKTFAEVQSAFHCFGEALAHLHEAALDCNAPAMNKDSRAFLKKQFTKILDPDEVIGAIRDRFEANSSENNELKFVHGNLRLDNVLRINKRICFIDFENCGIGSPYEDISRIFFQVIIMSIVPVLPVRRAFKFLFSFLEGYRSISHLDMDILENWTAVRAAIYYVGTFDKMPRIAKIPVSRQRLKRFVLCLLEGDIESALPGYALKKI